MAAKQKVIDLFAGGGGFGLGAHLADFSVALAIDNDADLVASHELNFPDVPLLLADIARLEPTEALEYAGCERTEVDGVIGGPPCQGFSVIGARNPADPRNAMLGHFFRFVRAIKPTFFVLENVPGLLHDGNRELLDMFLCGVRRSYNVSEPTIVNATAFGAATRRRRVVVVGIRRDAGRSLMADELLQPQVRCEATVRDAFEGLPDLSTAMKGDDGDWYARAQGEASGGYGAYARRARRKPPAGLAARSTRAQHREGYVSGFHPTEHSTPTLRRFRKLQPGEVDTVSRFPRLSWDLPAPTLRAGTGADHGRFQAARPIHPDEHRVITVREAARLQGFPDWFSFHATRWHSFRIIGNSVSPYVSQGVLSTVKRMLY